MFARIWDKRNRDMNLPRPEIGIAMNLATAVLPKVCSGKVLSLRESLNGILHCS